MSICRSCRTSLTKIKEENVPEIVNLDDSDEEQDDKNAFPRLVVTSPHFPVDVKDDFEDPIPVKALKKQSAAASDDDDHDIPVVRKKYKRVRCVIDSDEEEDKQSNVKIEDSVTTEARGINIRLDSSPASAEEGRQRESFPEIPNAYDAEIMDNMFDSIAVNDGSFGLDDDIHGDVNQNAFEDEGDSVAIFIPASGNIVDEVQSLGSSPVISPSHSPSKSISRSPLLSINHPNDPNTPVSSGVRRSARAVTLEEQRQNRMQELVNARNTKRGLVYDVPDSPPASQSRDDRHSFSPLRTIPEYLANQEERRPRVSNASSGIFGSQSNGVPRNNLDEMIEYVASFDLKKRIQELNPGKTNIDFEAVMTKMKTSRHEEDGRDTGRDLFRTEYGVHDAPSASNGHFIPASLGLQQGNSEPRAVFHSPPHPHPPPRAMAASSGEAIEVDLDDIDFDEPFTDDDEDIEVIPGPSHSNMCSTPSTSKFSCGLTSTNVPFQATLESTPGNNLEESFHEWNTNHGNDPKFKGTFSFTIDLMDAFKRVFKMNAFRMHQMEVMNAALLGFDCFVLMPTGGGKSLCYQLPAILGQGVTIVISPLKSLIFDQVSKLKGLGIEVSYMSGDMTSSEVSAIYRELRRVKPSVKLVYVTPERIGASAALKLCIPGHVFEGNFDSIRYRRSSLCQSMGS